MNASRILLFALFLSAATLPASNSNPILDKLAEINPVVKDPQLPWGIASTGSGIGLYLKGRNVAQYHPRIARYFLKTPACIAILAGSYSIFNAFDKIHNFTKK